MENYQALKAFPHLIDNMSTSTYDTPEESALRCYSLRSFDRFLDYFGLIEIESEKKWDTDKYILRTELFDKLIKCRSSKSG